VLSLALGAATVRTLDKDFVADCSRSGRARAWGIYWVEVARRLIAVAIKCAIAIEVLGRLGNH
jgi:hypothetical protein